MKTIIKKIDLGINFGIYLVCFCIPLALFHFKISWIPFNLIEALIYFLLILWLIKNLISKNLISELHSVLKKYQKLWLPSLLILLGVLISLLFSIQIKTGAGILKAWFIAPLIFLLIFLNQIKTKKQFKLIFICLWISGIITSLIALFYWLNNYLTYDNRLAAFYLSPNYLAMYLAPLLILSFYLFIKTNKKINRLILIVSYFLIIFIIYLTQSYSAWLALLGTTFFLLIFNINRKFIFFILALLIFGLGAQMPTDKFQKILDFSYPSLESRLVIWKSAWEITKDYSFLGIGPGLFQEYYLNYQKYFPPYPEWAVPQPHNLWLAFWLQSGLIGLVGFIWLIISFFRQKKPGFNKKPSLIIFATMLVILIHGLLDTPFWKADLAILFWLIIGLGYKANRLFY